MSRLQGFGLSLQTESMAWRKRMSRRVVADRTNWVARPTSDEPFAMQSLSWSFAGNDPFAGFGLSLQSESMEWRDQMSRLQSLESRRGQNQLGNATDERQAVCNAKLADSTNGLAQMMSRLQGIGLS